MEDGYVITVLGAGASVGCGYPLADDFFGCVKAFGESVSEKCPRLSQVIDYVVAKAEELDCLTPDDLALRMYQTRFGENRDEAINVLYYARLVTDAFFLATERQVSASAVRAYKDYWHEVLGNYSQTWRSGFPNTKHRLVTFNYDRLAELAFVRHFPEIANNGLDLYGPRMLNTGFSGWRSALKFEDGFCYLKLHGSVGVTPIGRNEVAAAFGDRFMHYAAALPNTKLEITDDLYFEAGGDGLPKRKLTPLVAFPNRRRLGDHWRAAPESNAGAPTQEGNQTEEALMASIHLQRNRPTYFAAFPIWHRDGRKARAFWSTGTANKRQAQRIAKAWEKAALAAHDTPKRGMTTRRPRKDQLSAEAEQHLIEQGIRQIRQAAGLETMTR